MGGPLRPPWDPWVPTLVLSPLTHDLSCFSTDPGAQGGVRTRGVKGGRFLGPAAASLSRAIAGTQEHLRAVQVLPFVILLTSLADKA